MKSKKPNLTIVVPAPAYPEPLMTPLLDAQKEFHAAYEVPINEAARSLYVELVDEEHEEWVEEFFKSDSKDFDELKELADLLYVTCALFHQMGYVAKTATAYHLKQDETWDLMITHAVEKIASGAKDKRLLLTLIYCIYCYADAMEWDLNEAYKRVHHSNMSKLGNDGKPVRRADGKILKGPNYKPPYLEDLTNGS